MVHFCKAKMKYTHCSFHSTRQHVTEGLLLWLVALQMDLFQADYCEWYIGKFGGQVLEQR